MDQTSDNAYAQLMTGFWKGFQIMTKVLDPVYMQIFGFGWGCS